MKSFQENMNEYRKQLEKGAIQKAYQGLMEYMMGLRTHFNKYPDYSVSGSIYYGYMDMTYFAVFPKSLKERDLKIAIVFLHDKFRFEVWLSGKNKQILTKYWKLFKESEWDKYLMYYQSRILSDNTIFRTGHIRRHVPEGFTDTD